ncbi:MAG TPA: hypothetical protein VG406_20425 [Isosphaeraceae bacterium]|jgi:hypothetical protein|nr:hypothetical protein [Isosphaeraceae bacterium]
MRLGTLRAAAFALLCAWTASATAGELFHNYAIPREVPAINLDTGGPIMQPPVPYGCYAKDYAGSLYGTCAKAKGLFHGGLFHHGNKACGACGGRGCGLCGGSGLCGGDGMCDNGAGGLCGNGGGLCGNGGGKKHGLGLGHGHVVATMPATGVAVVDPNAVVGSMQSAGCGACGGRGCGLCNGGGHGGHGGGLFGHHGDGACGDPGGGMGLGHGHGKDPCANCGGRGCKLCRGLHGLLGGLRGRHGVKYFVGAGGPVPLTPGYVPYIVTTRSPRDYFAFPPFSDPTAP